MPASYNLRFCQPEEVPRVMAFIDAYYRPGHALARKRELFDWQYRDSDDPKRYDMVVAVDSASSQLLGILGFVDSKRYDPALAAANCLWLALWQVKPDSRIPSLGPSLLRFLQSEVPHTSLAVSGIRSELRPLYRAMGFQVTELEPYFLLNPTVSEHHIARIPTGLTLPEPLTPENDVGLRTLDLASFATEAKLRSTPERTPRKTPTYFLNRYLRHPFYHYTVFAATRGEEAVGLLAARIVAQDGRQVMRIVDLWLADADLASLGPPLRRLVVESGCDYVDVLQSGLPDLSLRAAGFVPVSAYPGVTIPNYFEPFVRENSRITACFRTSETSPFIVCKGDGDQDRPNLT